MTIDERLEALTARHETMAQSLELMAAMHMDYQKRAEERMAKTEGHILTLTDAMTRLTEVVTDHERRLPPR